MYVSSVNLTKILVATLLREKCILLLFGIKTNFLIDNMYLRRPRKVNLQSTK